MQKTYRHCCFALARNIHKSYHPNFLQDESKSDQVTANQLHHHLGHSMFSRTQNASLWQNNKQRPRARSIQKIRDIGVSTTTYFQFYLRNFLLFLFVLFYLESYQRVNSIYLYCVTCIVKGDTHEISTTFKG